MLEQNYFQFDHQYYKQTQGLAIPSEVYIQYLELKQLYPVLLKHKIIECSICVDNILTIYNQKKPKCKLNSRQVQRTKNWHKILYWKTMPAPLISYTLQYTKKDQCIAYRIYNIENLHKQM
jgi:hypothetical protein